MFENLAIPEIFLASVVGISLATAVGFRVFIPLLLVGFASKTQHIQLAGGFEWLGSDVALVMLGIATVVEVIAYHIPYFDHLLDTLSGPVAIGAGTLLMASTLVILAIVFPLASLFLIVFLARRFFLACRKRKSSTSTI